MDLPIELQQQLEFQKQLEAQRTNATSAVDIARHKMEALRMAKEIVMENHKVASAGTVVEASDITAMAATLEAFVNN